MFWRPGSDAPDDLLGDASSDVSFQHQWIRHRNLSLRQQRERLPVFAKRDQFLDAVSKNDVVLFLGSSGSGKSTQLPQFLAEESDSRRKYPSVAPPPGRGGLVGKAAGRVATTVTSTRKNSIAVVVSRPIVALTLAERVSEERLACVFGTTGATEAKQRADVGYAIPFATDCGGHESIVFVTEDFMLQQMTVSDPLAMKYTHVILDDAHERSLAQDALLGVLLRIQKVRRCLKIIVTSATLDVESFVAYFERVRAAAFAGSSLAGTGAAKTAKDVSAAAGEEPAAKRAKRSAFDVPEDEREEFLHERKKEISLEEVTKAVGNAMERVKTVRREQPVFTTVSCEGRAFPVRVKYLAAACSDFVVAAAECCAHIVKRRDDFVETIDASHGDVLIFLPGLADVRECARLLKEEFLEREVARERVVVAVLYGGLAYHEQQELFAGNGRRGGPRRVICSTNIAESALTIPGVRFVVDSCFAKQGGHGAADGVLYRNVVACSKAACDQRAGRAGRTEGGGFCFRLITKNDYETRLTDVSLPGSLTTDLSRTLLQLKALGVDGLFTSPAAGGASLGQIADRTSVSLLMSPPTQSGLETALLKLFALGALDNDSRLTKPRGSFLAQFSASLEDPLLANLLFTALEQEVLFGLEEVRREVYGAAVGKNASRRVAGKEYDSAGFVVNATGGKKYQRKGLEFLPDSEDEQEGESMAAAAAKQAKDKRAVKGAKVVTKPAPDLSRLLGGGTRATSTLAASSAAGAPSSAGAPGSSLAAAARGEQESSTSLPLLSPTELHTRMKQALRQDESLLNMVVTATAMIAQKTSPFFQEAKQLGNKFARDRFIAQKQALAGVREGDVVSLLNCYHIFYGNTDDVDRGNSDVNLLQRKIMKQAHKTRVQLIEFLDKMLKEILLSPFDGETGGRTSKKTLRQLANAIFGELRVGRLISLEQKAVAELFARPNLLTSGQVQVERVCRCVALSLFSTNLARRTPRGQFEKLAPGMPGYTMSTAPQMSIGHSSFIFDPSGNPLSGPAYAVFFAAIGMGGETTDPKRGVDVAELGRTTGDRDRTTVKMELVTPIPTPWVPWLMEAVGVGLGKRK